MEKVVAVTVNFRTPEDTVQTVEALLASEGVDLRMVLVENGSGDDSWGKLTAALGSNPRVELVRSATNTGFSGGNNQGIRRALEGGATHVFLVSSDVTVEPGAARTLVDAMATYGAAAAQPLMLSRKDERVDTMGHMIDPRLDMVVDAGHGELLPDLGPADAHEVFGVCAGAAMYRRDVFEKVGLLLEDFFIYYEDVDLSFRLRYSGESSLLVPGAGARHTRYGSAGGFTLKFYYAERNWLCVKLRHYPPEAIMSTRFVRVVVREAVKAWRSKRLGEYTVVLARSFVAPHAAPPAARRALQQEWRGVPRRPPKAGAKS